ncbi:DNA-binding response regulator [Actinomyces massiliensis]|uniref:Response regulator receiver domain protein n=1 Tax=Actinomyces massiliensis F0489 TaxID=1125718 RepID=J0XE26_9ACTO|nr:response regulator transcription factor [Actinomyces massiliensis]EJF46981.1 response regulator receiver domain protein [Actinomyces massiliensis F0489]
MTPLTEHPGYPEDPASPDSPAPAIRIVIADDETLIREALEAILSLQADIDVVAVAASGTEAIVQIERHRPDVAVLDLLMPGADGIEVAAAISDSSRSSHSSQRTLQETKCLILTSHARPGYLKRALAAGVRGFVPKTTPAARLTEIIRRLHAGQRYVDPELSAEAIAAGDSPLTPREADVLELAADGAPVEEIARRAHLSPGTVRNYLSAAALKLSAPNRHAAAEIARSKGWI